MIEVPQEIEDALWQAARDRLGRAVGDRRALVAAIIGRSRMYTSERDQLDDYQPGSTSDLAARAVFFSVADAAKMFVPLAELAHRNLLPQRAELQILDVGAGVGAMTLGALAFFARHDGAAAPGRIHVRAIDRDAAALAMMKASVAGLPEPWRAGVTVDVHPRVLGAKPLPPAAADLVFAGTVLNELPRAARLELVRQLLDRLAPDGAVIIIEPALKDTSRALEELRDEIIGANLATVFAPCTRASAPCPALASERDWCHEDRPALLPPRARRLADATGLRQHGLKFSYLVLRKGTERLAPPAESGTRVLRVVSRPRKLKGRRECFACGEHGRTRLRLLKRNRSPQTAAFEAAARGDILLVGESDELGQAPVSRTRIELP